VKDQREEEEGGTILDTITFNVNNVDIAAEKGKTILQAVYEADIRYADVDIPTLYYLKDINETDDSGVCVVEIAGEDGLIPAWSYPVREGLRVLTDTENTVAARQKVLYEIVEAHDHDCTGCTRTGNCELQELLHKYGIKEEKRDNKKDPIDESAVVVRDVNKCIRCKRCVAVCENVQGIGAIGAEGDGLSAKIGPVSECGLNDTDCVNCGQCITVCPVGALTERDDTDEVLAALGDRDKFVIVQTAPSVRAALGEAFGFPLGVDTEGRLAAVLRRLGFDKVFDTKFGAELTIMEEANEFMDRVKNGGTLPMMTSCCPGWIKYCEHFFPDMIGNLSSCKSPQQMFGAIAKSFYAEKMGIDKDDIVVVSVMPCVAKKFELTRDDEAGAGVPDVDYSITTRELARMIGKAEIQLDAMPAEAFDLPLGLGAGAGVIFGATGGVMEAALRTVVEKLSGKELEKLEFSDVRGLSGIKEASYDIAGMNVKVAVASGLANAKELMTKVQSGEADYHFIEIMACPGGCVNGGGQPQQMAPVRAVSDIRSERAKALYSNDEGSVIRKSHENPAIIELYDDYLGEPGSEKAHKLLHTSYVRR
jgi:NADP-reducing hydrogenase subunit HndD